MMIKKYKKRGEKTSFSIQTNNQITKLSMNYHPLFYLK